MTNTLTITLAQLNPVVGDIGGNVEKILKVYAEHKTTADIIVYTEMVISGYPTDDLVLKPFFIDHVMASVEKLAARVDGAGAALLVSAPWREDGKVYNTALLLHGGKIVEKRFKNHLPNYGVFDEARVFSPGPLPLPMTFRGVKLGVMTCEDMWFPDVAAHLKKNGAVILLVPNGSPYEIDKTHTRMEQARARVAETGLPLVYTNQVGGQDELVFDGGSFALDHTGKTLTQLPTHREYVSVTVWSFSPSPAGREKEGARDSGKDEGSGTPDNSCVMKPSPQPSPASGRGILVCKSFEAPHDVHSGSESIYQTLVLGLRDYVDKNGFPGVVLGMSGGIDSALSAAIAVDALGAGRVKTVMMPSPYTSRESIDDAEECCKLLGIHHRSIPIAPAMTAFDEMLGGAKGLTAENIQARARGLVLMALSNATGSMVLSTGNKSEMSVGYATLYGDMCGGFNALKDVYKMTVFELARWRNQCHPANALGPPGRVIPENIISKPPSAELRPDQKDEDSLPPYPVLDDILFCLIEKEMDFGAIVAKGHAPETVNRVWTLLDRAEYKRRQACPGVKISSKAFGRDRRYPIVNKFTDIIAEKG